MASTKNMFGKPRHHLVQKPSPMFGTWFAGQNCDHMGLFQLSGVDLHSDDNWRILDGKHS